MDALIDMLRIARLTGGVYLRAEFSAPWCIAAQMSPDMCAPFLKHASHLVPYHYVVEGSFHAALEKDAPVALQSGDLMFFVSTRSDLDVFHCGMIVREGSGVLMRHASRSHGAVVEQELGEFLKANRMTGVIVVRPREMRRRSAGKRRGRM